MLVHQKLSSNAQHRQAAAEDSPSVEFSEENNSKIVRSELTVHDWMTVQSSIMANKNSTKESQETTLSWIKEEMAKPRISKSARSADPEILRAFPLSGSEWPGLARLTRRPRRLVTHPGAS